MRPFILLFGRTTRPREHQDHFPYVENGDHAVTIQISWINRTVCRRITSSQDDVQVITDNIAVSIKIAWQVTSFF
jgi:hypothetical protein